MRFTRSTRHKGIAARSARWSADVLVRPMLAAPWSLGAVALAVLAVGGIGLLASDTGDSLAILYVLPPLAVTALVNRAAGLVVSLEAAAVWALANSSAAESGALLFLNAALRFLVVGLVVLLVSGLRSAMLRAQRSDERSRDFLGLAAHQLRTPLAGIRAASEALIDLGSTPGQEQLLARLAAESERAAKLVSRLLAIAKLEGAEGVPTRPTDLASLSRECLALLDDRAPGVSTTFEIEPSRPGAPSDSPEPATDRRFVVLANPEACRHMLGNLLENAARHARTGVAVHLAADRGRARLAVHDDGPGLPRGSEDLAFECFVSLDGAGGSGLGLPLSRGLARSFGGDLTYEQGAFVLVLPVAHGAGQDVVVRPAARRPAPTGGGD